MLKKVNNKLLIVAMLYLLLPIMIFLLGFLNVFVGILASALLCYCGYRIYKKETNFTNEYKKNRVYMIGAVIILMIWLIYSGIGGYSFQNSDYEVRNAVFNDLISCKWPIIYDFSQMDPQYVEYFGLQGGAGFVYYFTYWLPSALMGKLFGLKFANLFLHLWSLLGLCIVVGLINNFCKKQSLWTWLFLIGFSGLDILYYLGTEEPFFGINHIEWWDKYIQYSSNTTTLYWVFNQVIPCWVIVSLLLSLKEKTSIMFVACLVFAYSPFATFGFIPLAIFLIIQKSSKKTFLKDMKQLFLSSEFLWVVVELIIYGTFYVAAESSISVRGFVWKVENISFGLFLLKYYIPFILVEIGIYFLLLRKHFEKNKLFWFIIIELLLIPLYKMTPANDFCMRAALAPLFMLSILTTKFFVEMFEKDNKGKMLWKENKLRIVVFACLFIFGLSTPLHEINRSFTYTNSMTKEQYIMEHSIGSVGNPKTSNGIALCDAQFYAKDYQNKFFFKYLARK